MLKLIDRDFTINSWSFVTSKDNPKTRYIKLSLQDLKGNNVEIFDSYTNNKIFYDQFIDRVKEVFNSGYPFVNIRLRGLFKNDFKSFEIESVISISGVDFDDQLSNAFPDVQ